MGAAGNGAKQLSSQVTEEDLINEAIRASMQDSTTSASSQTLGGHQAPSHSASGLSEAEEIALAIAASEQEEQRRKQTQDESEEEMIKRAIAESEAHEANEKR